MRHHHSTTQRRLLLAAILTGSFCLVEVLGGLWSGSLALLSDAGHMFADFLAIGIVLASIIWSARPVSPRKTYGYYRAEILATLINGALLLFVATEILFEAWRRMGQVSTIALHIMLPIAGMGLLVNLCVAFILHGSKHHLATRSAYYHVLGDLAASIAVLLSGWLIHVTGLVIWDVVVSVFLALVLIYGALRVLREAIDILMEGVPGNLSLNDVQTSLLALPQVLAVSDLHVWTIGSGRIAASAHIAVAVQDLTQGPAIAQEIGQHLEKYYNISHTTIQIHAQEIACGPCQPCC